tara:strand:+ start:704 stop:1120 length:417 start_codon:yes stop_codon:yes gene_type:complete
MPKETKKTSTKKAKKATPKKASTKKPSGPTKAAMASALKEKGIPLPESGEASDMEHRLRHWKSGMGYMIRIHRNAGGRYANHPLSLLDSPRKALYWLPDSDMTDKIIATRRVVVVGRASEPSSNMVVIDVPSDYETRF